MCHRGLAALSALLLIAPWLPGCAGPPKGESIRTSAPTPDEYPRIPTREDALIQASVVAERDSDEPRVRFVPDVEEPELTPEEKEAAGQFDPPYKLLPHAYPGRIPGSLVSSDNGLETRAAPTDRGIGVSRDSTGIAGVGHDPDSVEIGVEPFISRILGLLAPHRAAYAGPDEQADIGIRDRRTGAKARRNRED